MSAPGRAVTGLAALVVLSACTGQPEAIAPTDVHASPSGTLTVLAAASLSDVFEELGGRLEDANPDLDVQFSFAGSSALATQALQGAAADVFASADEAQMARLQDAGLVDDADAFARNSLMLAVPRDNPRGIVVPEGRAGTPSLAELITADSTVAVCAPEVPCGAAAAEALAAAGLADAPDTYEDDVRAVLTKVRLGEVDAGLVYLSDVHAAGDSILAYAFGEAAQAFVELVLSDAGQQILADAGFLPPS